MYQIAAPNIDRSKGNHHPLSALLCLSDANVFWFFGLARSIIVLFSVSSHFRLHLHIFHFEGILRGYISFFHFPSMFLCLIVPRHCCQRGNHHPFSSVGALFLLFRCGCLVDFFFTTVSSQHLFPCLFILLVCSYCYHQPFPLVIFDALTGQPPSCGGREDSTFGVDFDKNPFSNCDTPLNFPIQC